MGDVGEAFKATKELRAADSRKRKQSNKSGSMEMLHANNIEFEEKNCGYHLVVKHSGKIADFWPSTGKFNIRGDSRYFRGVRLLIKIMRGDYNEQQFKSLQGER